MEDHEKKLSLSKGRYIESCIHALVKRYFVTLKLRGSNGIEVYFIAKLEVHQIWREIIVKTLLTGFSYCKLFHAFESLRRIEFLVKFVFGLEGNDVLP